MTIYYLFLFICSFVFINICSSQPCNYRCAGKTASSRQPIQFGCSVLKNELRQSVIASCFVVSFFFVLKNKQF